MERYLMTNLIFYLENAEPRVYHQPDMPCGVLELSSACKICQDRQDRSFQKPQAQPPALLRPSWLNPRKSSRFRKMLKYLHLLTVISASRSANL